MRQALIQLSAVVQRCEYTTYGNGFLQHVLVPDKMPVVPSDTGPLGRYGRPNHRITAVLASRIASNVRTRR
jgi:hypothetical protein